MSEDLDKLNVIAIMKLNDFVIELAKDIERIKIKIAELESEGKDTVSQFTHDLMNTEGDKDEN